MSSYQKSLPIAEPGEKWTLMEKFLISILNKVMIRFIYILPCSFWFCNKSPVKDSVEDLPNILFFFADDFDAIHALGNDIIETPNLDRMVLNGTVLTKPLIWVDGMVLFVWPREP